MAESSIELRDAVVEKLRLFLDHLQQACIDVDAAYLYGSHAAGSADPHSDIDVAVVSPDLSGDRLQDWMTLNRISSRIDGRMEVIGFRPDQFRDENPLVWEVKTRGMQVA